MLRVGGEVPLYIEQGGQSQPTAPVRDAADYIDALKVMMLGYAKAGISPLADAPADEPLGSGTINFVECPLDVVMRYANRADIQSSLIPFSQRFEWLRVRDQAERMRWVEMHRNTQMSLGAVIELVYTQRDGAWQPPEAAQSQSSSSAQQPKRAIEPAPPSRGEQLATHSGDGQKFCVAFQKSRGDRGKRCPDLHACAVIMGGGRICSVKGHGAVGHHKAMKAGKAGKR